MAGMLENILIMILTVVVLLGGGYLVLVVLGWAMNLKSGNREQEGLTDLLNTLTRQQHLQKRSSDQKSEKNDSL